MSLRNKVRSTRNSLDFALRKSIQLGFPVRKALAADLQFQKDMAVFFSTFDWRAYVSPSRKPFRVLDVGARNFSLAPVFHRLFLDLGVRPEVHGVEIDAYRRLRNFRTRRDYADFFVSQVSDSQFHVGDFLGWQLPADCLFALNPFVTESPLLAWGLPLKLFRPQEFFEHVAELLEVGEGLLFVTNPSEEEVAITRKLLKPSFELLETHDWFSSAGGYPRFGALYRRV